MIGRFGTTLPRNCKQIPRVDRRIEIDERSHSFCALIRADTDRTCLSELLQVYDSLWGCAFRFCCWTFCLGAYWGDNVLVLCCK